MNKIPFFIVIFVVLGVSGILDYYLGLQSILGTITLFIVIFMIERYYHNNEDNS